MEISYQYVIIVNKFWVTFFSNAHNNLHLLIQMVLIKFILFKEE